jgi:hypothetical protein
VAEILRFVRSKDPQAAPRLISNGSTVPMPPTVREMLERAIANQQAATTP